MKVVVIGATGHIGTYLVPMLVEAGFETIAITRGESQPYESHPAWEKVERLLQKAYQENSFPMTVVAPGQISGPGYRIINPWGNTSLRVIQDIADGKAISLPNFGQEIIHHVHGYDVAQLFFKAITHRDNALGQIFDAHAEEAITLYGYAKHLYNFFDKEAQIDFLAWKDWCEYEGNPEECDHTYYHIVRSGFFSIQNAKALLDYQPRYTNLETIDLAVQSYIDRGEIVVS